MAKKSVRPAKRIPPAAHQFKPGQVANPSGVNGYTNGANAIRTLARKYTEEAIETLADVMRRGKPKDRAYAASALLDRGWGKPAQSVEHSGSGGGPISAALSLTANLSDDEVFRLAERAIERRKQRGDIPR